jgi:hypothetical protein
VKISDRIQEELDADERCEWIAGALRTIGPTSAAGKLCLSSKRILFVPNRYGNLKQRSVWSIGRGEILAIDVAGRTWQPYNGGLRRRLRVTSRAGDEELFGVNKVDAVVRELRSRLSLRTN